MKPEGAVHIVEKIGHADFHGHPGQTDRSYEEGLRFVLVSKDELNMGTVFRFATVGASDMISHGKFW